MTLDIAAYQAKRYGPQPCWELVADIYAQHLGAIAVEYQRAQRSIKQMADGFRLALHGSAHGFMRTAVPDDLAVVLMGRHVRMGLHHCGIWYAGRILHAEPSMTLYEEPHVVRARYPLMEFWHRAH